MSTKWEYAQVRTLSKANKIDGEWEIERNIVVNRPDGTTSRDADENDVLVIANGMGAEGWEMISDEVLTRTVGAAQGYPNSGYPIARRLWFKRPVKA